MKYFLLLSSILLTCFCVLIYLAKIQALGNDTLQENLLGATTAAIIAEGALTPKSSGASDIDRRIDRLEERINQELGKLNDRVAVLEAKLKKH